MALVAPRERDGQKPEGLEIEASLSGIVSHGLKYSGRSVGPRDLYTN
jgi:hypothetical protein